MFFHTVVWKSGQCHSHRSWNSYYILVSHHCGYYGNFSTVILRAVLNELRLTKSDKPVGERVSEGIVEQLRFCVF